MISLLPAPLVLVESGQLQCTTPVRSPARSEAPGAGDECPPNPPGAGDHRFTKHGDAAQAELVCKKAFFNELPAQATARPEPH